ncbi:MAG: hypothetical protein JOZ80_06890 [Acidobacteriaceae bacterium]|nr:hypothetical protein [Acidobacteriaceae bacterium]
MTFSRRETTAVRALGLAFLVLSFAMSGLAQEVSPATGTVKVLGTIKSISGNNLTVTSDSGTSNVVTTEDSTRMLRTEPGAKDLKSAIPITTQDLQIGDRVLARGKPGDDGKSMVASSLILIKASDVVAKQQQEREDWQKRGVGGLVTAVDASAGTVTISNSAIAGNKTTTVRISKNTIIRRYAPDSVKFDDAKPGTVDQIKVGDQLRARGTRSADASEVNADEIVSGSFRNIAGQVISADAADNSVTVRDLISKKPVTLKINPDSQLRNLPPMVAQRIAARLKHEQGGTSGTNAQAAPAETGGGQNAGGFRRPGGPPDFQQMLNRMPPVRLADLQKGAAVMIVATEGSAASDPTAVTLLTGVEDILSASPDGSRAAMLLSPWNLGGADAAAASQ